MAARNIAEALAGWCGTDEVNGAQLADFYADFKDAKRIVQMAKAPGQKPGLQSFITLHRDLLSARMQDGVLYVGRAEDDIDSISELSKKLKALAGHGNEIPLQAVSDMLQPLKNGDSMRHFASRMKEAALGRASLTTTSLTTRTGGAAPGKNQTCVASLGSQRNGRPSKAAAAATSEGFDRRRRRRPPVDDGACTAVAS